jgi:hypothetical protein
VRAHRGSFERVATGIGLQEAKGLPMTVPAVEISDAVWLQRVLGLVADLNGVCSARRS